MKESLKGKDGIYTDEVKERKGEIVNTELK